MSEDKATFLMCSPDHYDVYYEINPFMKIGSLVDQRLAKQQWNILVSKIKECGGSVVLIEGVPGYPDMVFTSNAGLVHKKDIILSNFYHKERSGETPFYRKYFQSQNYNIINDPLSVPYSFEGEAEVLLVEDNWFLAIGPRSQKEFYKNTDFFKNLSIHYCELVNDFFYHLDTCLLHLGNGECLWYPDAFSLESQRNISKYLNLHSIPYEEAMNLACNAIVIDKNVILPSGCPVTEKIISNLGYNTHSVDMSEFIKSGGACGCLTLRIQ